MSLFHIYQSTDNNSINFGTVVVIDSGKVRTFDTLNDSKTDIVGVVTPKTRLSGRQIVDGDVLYKNEGLVYTEFYQYALDGDNNYISNTNYDPNFDYTTDNSYQNVCVHGLAPVLTTSALNPNWILIDGSHGATTALYLIK